MTELLEKAIAAAQILSADMQDEIARMVLAYTGEEQSVVQLTVDEEADLAESDAEEASGAFATEAQMRAIWAKHGG